MQKRLTSLSLGIHNLSFLVVPMANAVVLRSSAAGPIWFSLLTMLLTNAGFTAYSKILRLAPFNQSHLLHLPLRKVYVESEESEKLATNPAVMIDGVEVVLGGRGEMPKEWRYNTVKTRIAPLIQYLEHEVSWLDSNVGGSKRLSITFATNPAAMIERVEVELGGRRLLPEEWQYKLVSIASPGKVYFEVPDGLAPYDGIAEIVVVIKGREFRSRKFNWKCTKRWLEA